MSELVSGPHLWVLAVSLVYASLIDITIARIVRASHLSTFGRVMWGIVVAAIPLGGAVVFWATRWRFGSRVPTSVR